MIVRIAGPDDLLEAYALRHAVFVGEQRVPEELEVDGGDDTAIHAVALDDGVVLGTGRLRIGARAGTIGRMAVHPAARGRGIGGLLLHALESAATDAGLSRTELHAQRHAESFYRHAGYRPISEPFTEAGIEHVRMAKELAASRDVTDADGPALSGLIESCWSAYPGCVLDIDGEEPWLRAPAAAYREFGGRMWVVECSGQLVACVGSKPHEKATELKSLYVAAAARCHGLGTRLVRLVEHDAGSGEVVLWSDARFTDAHRLYRRLGYAATGAQRQLHDLSHTTEYEFSRVL